MHLTLINIFTINERLTYIAPCLILLNADNKFAYRINQILDAENTIASKRIVFVLQAPIECAC